MSKKQRLTEDDVDAAVERHARRTGLLLPRTSAEVASNEVALEEAGASDLPQWARGPNAFADLLSRGERPLAEEELPEQWVEESRELHATAKGKFQGRSSSGCVLIALQLRPQRRRMASSSAAEGPAPERVAEIQQLAESISLDRFPQGAVDPVVILNSIKVTHTFGSYGDNFDGLLEWNGDSFHVFCNLERVEKRTSARARFTLAHELGHYFIDEHRNALRQGAGAHPSSSEFESNQPIEREADEFAAALLMPQTRFLRAAKREAKGLPGILELARAFGTSVTGTAIRYAKANLNSCIVVKWSADRLGWKWMSDVAFRSRFGRTIDSPTKVIPSSPTQMALDGATPPSAGYFERGTTASAWFPNVADGSGRDVIMVEQAISLGRFGALTILMPEAMPTAW